MRFARFVGFVAVMAQAVAVSSMVVPATVITTAVTVSSSAPAEAGIFGFFSFDINRTLITADPDILMSVNVRPKGGSRRSLVGFNDHKGVHCLVADLDVMELVPVVGVKRKPLEIIKGGYTTFNTGDYKDWTPLKMVNGNKAATVDLEQIGNGDQFLRMWLLVKNGNREEIHWPFGGTAKEHNLDSSGLFSFHVLSIRDGEGNLFPRFLKKNGQTDYDEVLQVLKEYGSGVTPSILLKASREKEPAVGDQSGPSSSTPNNGPCLILQASRHRYVMVQWYKPDGTDGQRDQVVVDTNQPATVAVPAGHPTYDLYERESEDKDWNPIKPGNGNGSDEKTPSPTGRRTVTITWNR
jgi:hypothetical protein